jgi:integrase
MKKRGNCFYYRIHKQAGEHWIALGSDYTAACQKLRELKQEGPGFFTSTVVSEVVNWWLESYVATERNEKNQRLARQRARDFLIQFLGTKPLVRVRANDLRGYRLWLERSKRLSPQSVVHVLSDSRCFFRWCEDSGYIAQSPFPRRLMPKIQERPPDRLTDAEVEKLISLEEPLGFMMRFALETGLRWGELVKLQSTDIQGRQLLVHGTKSGKVRRIPLSASILRELRGRVGLLMPQGSYWNIVLRIRRLSGLKSFHPHQTRHTFACRWLERGGSLAALQQILGHASIVTTQRYAKLTDAAILAEAGQMGELWGKTAG